MSVVRITRHAGHVDLDSADAPGSVIESPEMTKAEAKAQAELVEANLCTHHERTVTPEGEPDVTETHKPAAQGVPGTPLDLGWVQILNDTIDTVEVV